MLEVKLVQYSDSRNRHCLISCSDSTSFTAREKNTRELRVSSPLIGNEHAISANL